MKKSVLVVLLLLLASCTSSEPPLPPPAPTLSWTGYGPVRFGMTVKEAEAVAGPRADADADRMLSTECDYLQFASLPGIRLMVEAGVITRGDAGPGIGNALGIAVGDTLASVRAAHPKAQVSPHKYDPAGHSVWFAAPDGKAGIVMEAQNGLITRIRAGRVPAVGYVESCS